MNNDDIFDYELQMADGAGYQPDPKTMTHILLTRIAVPDGNLDKTRKFLIKSQQAMNHNSELAKQFNSLLKQLNDYLVWSVPYLYYDDGEDPTINRAPDKEAKIIKSAQSLVDNLKQQKNKQEKTQNGF